MKHAILAFAAALAVACGSNVTVQPGGAGGSGASTSTSGSTTGSSSSSSGTVPPDLTACQVPSDCVVVPQSCCGSCGAATRGDAIAINKGKLSEHAQAVCGDDQGCPECYMPRDPTLLGTCQGGHCVLVDLHEHPVAACNVDGDCMLRTQACCECGGDTGPEGLIAINQSSQGPYMALVCDPDQGCAKCLPGYPADAFAMCNPEGYCEVAWPVDG